MIQTKLFSDLHFSKTIFSVQIKKIYIQEQLYHAEITRGSEILGWNKSS